MRYFISYHYFILNINFRTSVGSWTAGVPSEIDFDPGMEDEIAMFNTKRVYKIVSVIQQPFMQWNDTLGIDQDFK